MLCKFCEMRITYRILLLKLMVSGGPLKKVYLQRSSSYNYTIYIIPAIIMHDLINLATGIFLKVQYLYLLETKLYLCPGHMTKENS